MPGAYTSFDTLTLELGERELSERRPVGRTMGELPLLARLPLVTEEETPGEPTTYRHVDAAHTLPPSPKTTNLPGLIQSQASSIFEVRADQPAAIAVVEPGTNDPGSIEPANAPLAPAKEAPEPPTEQAPPVAPEFNSFGLAPADRLIAADEFSDQILPPAPRRSGQQAVDEPTGLIGVLLRLEAIIAPHSQIIVLLTLLAAAGLTVMLLSGSNATLESGPTSPPVADASQPSIASNQPVPRLADLAGEPYHESAVPTSRPQAAAGQPSARGPVGVPVRAMASAGVSQAQPLQPHRELNSSSPPTVRTALTPLPYPATEPATAGQAPADRPIARLTGRIDSQQQKTK